MPLTPEKFTGPRIQPIAAGQISARARGSSKKDGALLRDLEMTKLEGDPLTLFGNSLELTADHGSEPNLATDTVPAGDRIRLWGGRGATYKTVLGAGEVGDMWYQVPGNLATDAPLFRWFASTTCVMKLTRRTTNGIIQKPFLLIGEDDSGVVLPSSPLHVRGPISIDRLLCTGGETVGQDQGVYFCDAAGGAFTLTLPAVAAIIGRIYVFKRTNAGANTVALDVSGGGTIDGAATKTLGSQYAAVGLYAADTQWLLLWTYGTVT